LQEEIIHDVLAGKDVFAVLPTGGGKSLCFQLPALLFGGLTVVVSPLISLMQDQVDQLRQWGVSAAALNSSLHPAHYSETMAHIRQGRVKLLYLAPETLLRPETQLLLQQCPIDSFVIDEAHCISAWGHDFRPEYRQLSQVRARLPQAVCLALTATATHRVRQDILQLLGIAADNEFVASFDRPNLRLWVQPRQNGQAQVLDFLAEHTGESGIIYCTTRRQVDELTIYLQRQGISALSYHAGLDDGTRQSNQRRFSQDDVAVMVATVAFGMGIDKSNVRFVLHYNLPKDLESYYQEIGRAGRDGLPADCLLLFSRGDLYTIQQLLGQGAAETQQAAGLRLQAMLCYAESQICRRRPLLDYFGETYSADDCAACDNCLRNDVPEQADLTIPAQKFLSCVLRTGQNFGMSHLIDVLRGAQTQKILQRRHNQLSTYGIGTEYSKKQWQQLVQQFIQGGLLVQDMEFGSLQLTEAGRAVLRGEPFMGVAVEVAEGKGKRPLTDRPARAVTFDYDQALFAQLRAKRKEIADEQGVPAFVILHDRSLMEMAARLPETAEALSHVYGVGEAKAAHYAPYFLPILADWRATHPHPPAPPVRPDGEQPDEAAERIRRMVAQQGNRTDGVWRVFQMGYSLAEIAAALGFTPDTILRHVAKMVEEGYSVELVRLQQESSLSEEEIAAVTAVFTELGMDKLRPVFDHFGGAVSYLDLKIVLLMMQD
jgi:ATP-dependent DNA helicase RecQ